MQQHCYMLASQYLILDQIWTHTGWYLEQHGWTAICKYLLIAPCACKNQQIKYQILVSFVYQFLQSEHYQLLLYSPSSTLFALVLPLNITNLATIPPKLWQQGRDQGFSMRLSYWEKGKIQPWQHSDHQLINSHWCKETKQQAGKYSSESKYQTEGFQIAVSIVGKQSIQTPLGKTPALVLIQETSDLLTHKTQIQARAGAISQKSNASGRQPKYFFHQDDKKGRGKMELKIGSHQGTDAWPRLPVRMLPLCLNFRKLPFLFVAGAIYSSCIQIKKTSN